MYSLVVYVPETHLEELLDALFDAGAGRYGGYDRCAFCARGEGRFRPLPGASPYLGSIGSEHRTAEVRAETIVPGEAVAAVVAALRRAHPYEEPAFHLYRIEIG
jgi:hypothetical protein